ncbi:hypothetical protein BABINDRAFT_7392 [Babjeviella inositovora NRRL Y-12698]|uniref:GOLD domain-containing protein n=1 Tax=Babjeviella inositovora NRRL Y-12698 TaxID=984486 RepID=A0A1E3QSK6_9ASCO|nr:uncharacterized protein BABINDRAFT_7392 [Babjeviella inositovora NRRL Y-12698]ODQ80685.1 hypothetical protein BABINDRAFT_7392 [Babjeviella inositovora NRRL Y-12698]
MVRPLSVAFLLAVLGLAITKPILEHSYTSFPEARVTFDVPITQRAHLAAKNTDKIQRVCLRYRVPQSALVALRVETSEKYHNQELNVDITDLNDSDSLIRRKNDIVNQVEILFKADGLAMALKKHDEEAPLSEFDVCFLNIVLEASDEGISKEVTLSVDFDTSVDGESPWQKEKLLSIQKSQPLLVRLQETIREIEEVERQLEYLVAREEKLRNVNEDTFKKWTVLAIMVMCALVVMGILQARYITWWMKNKI